MAPYLVQAIAEEIRLRERFFGQKGRHYGLLRFPGVQVPSSAGASNAESQVPCPPRIYGTPYVDQGAPSSAGSAPIVHMHHATPVATIASGAASTPHCMRCTPTACSRRQRPLASVVSRMTKSFRADAGGLQTQRRGWAGPTSRSECEFTGAGVAGRKAGPRNKKEGSLPGSPNIGFDIAVARTDGQVGPGLYDAIDLHTDRPRRLIGKRGRSCLLGMKNVLARVGTGRQPLILGDYGLLPEQVSKRRVTL